MCLSLPGKIITIDENSELRMADVDFGGVRREVCVEWVPEANIGDYVLVHVGVAINLIDEKEAMLTFNYLQQIGEINELEES